VNVQQALSIVEQALNGQAPAARLGQAVIALSAAETRLRAKGEYQLAEYVSDRLIEAQR